jgi:hypothetical protein
MWEIFPIWIRVKKPQMRWFAALELGWDRLKEPHRTLRMCACRRTREKPGIPSHRSELVADQLLKLK